MAPSTTPGELLKGAFSCTRECSVHFPYAKMPFLKAPSQKTPFIAQWTKEERERGQQRRKSDAFQKEEKKSEFAHDCGLHAKFFTSYCTFSLYCRYIYSTLPLYGELKKMTFHASIGRFLSSFPPMSHLVYLLTK